MSINSLTNAALARRRDVFPSNRAPNGVAEIAQAASGLPRASSRSAPEGAGQPGSTEGSADSSQTALNLLFGYIPTEIVTCYVATITAFGNINSAGLWRIFYITLCITPMTVLVIYAVKLKKLGLSPPRPLNPKTWPMWEMIAATLAFTAWAFGLPQSPFKDLPWYNGGFASLVLVLASTLLGLIAPLFQQPIKT